MSINHIRDNVNLITAAMEQVFDFSLCLSPSIDCEQMISCLALLVHCHLEGPTAPCRIRTKSSPILDAAL